MAESLSSKKRLDWLYLVHQAYMVIVVVGCIVFLVYVAITGK